MTHASLQIPLVKPAELEPKQKMGRNDLCWCGSGRKWKRCHLDRESRPPPIPGEQTSRLYREFQKGYCSHPDASPDNCSDKIVRAHTVQRRGGIAAIAESGHVISVKSAMQDLVKNDGAFVPRKIGGRRASTFMGFCAKHDNAMFQPVEKQSFTLSPQSCFLLGFRALSNELFSKRAELRAMQGMRELDSGKPFAVQCQWQQDMNLREFGSKRALADLERWKSRYDSIFLNGRFEEYRYVGVTFSSILPVVGCGAFHPEFDFAGNPLQRIMCGNEIHEHVGFNLTVLDGRSVLVIGWTGEHNGPAEAFGGSFMDVPDEQKANLGIQLAVERLENIYLKPSWWDGLSNTIRRALKARMRSGLGASGPDRRSDCLRPDGHPYTMDVDVVELVGPSCARFAQ